jgi:hypothetical protein
MGTIIREASFDQPVHPVGKISHMPLGWRAEEEMIQKDREIDRQTERDIKRPRERETETWRYIEL